MRTRFTRLVAASVAALSVASVGAATAAQASGPTLGTTNIAEMGAFIDTALDGKVVGYSYAIAKGGQHAISNAEGKARTNGDGNVDFTTNTRIEIASATKNVTAAAVLQLLEKNNLSVDTKVNGYFPFNWDRGDGWEDVTFRMLLSHRSGLKQQGNALGSPSNWKTLWSGVQFAVSQPIVADNGYSYSNMNYASLRVLLARLWKIAEPTNGMPSLNSTNSGMIALAYANKYLLQPAGIFNVDCSSGSAFIYDLPGTGNPGRSAALKGEDLEACAGHRGLNMSAMDMVRWQAHLAHGNVVSSSVRNLMDNTSGHSYGSLGWSGRRSGGVFFHGGDISVGGQDVHTCQGKFGGGIEASLIINSQQNGFDVCQVLIDAAATQK